MKNGGEKKNIVYYVPAGPSGRAVQGVGLRPLACWGRGFESHRGHGCLSVVSVVCCQVEVSATSWPLFQRRPADCGRVKTERDGTRAETRFGLPAKRTSPFISAGVSVQSSTGFLGMRVF